MTADWIRANLPLDANGNVLLAQDVHAQGDGIVIDPDTLASITAGVPDVATHAALSALPISGAGGWQPFFDAWKTAGCIS